MTDREDEAFTVVALGPDTWDLFEGLAGRHNGVFGGCWCIYFHPDGPERGQGAEANREHRRHGLAEVALRGALELIARAGGGVVEGYPHEIGEKKMSSSFLYNGTRGLYERVGFEYVRPKGLRNCVMRRSVDPSH